MREVMPRMKCVQCFFYSEFTSIHILSHMALTMVTVCVKFYDGDARVEAPRDKDDGIVAKWC